MKQTYCEKQINAKDTTCQACWKRYFFTDHQQTVCIACQRDPLIGFNPIKAIPKNL